VAAERKTDYEGTSRADLALLPWSLHSSLADGRSAVYASPEARFGPSKSFISQTLADLARDKINECQAEIESRTKPSSQRPTFRIFQHSPLISGYSRWRRSTFVSYIVILQDDPHGRSRRLRRMPDEPLPSSDQLDPAIEADLERARPLNTRATSPVRRSSIREHRRLQRTQLAQAVLIMAKPVASSNWRGSRARAGLRGSAPQALHRPPLGSLSLSESLVRYQLLLCARPLEEPGSLCREVTRFLRVFGL